jgi:hypothetical protein
MKRKNKNMNLNSIHSRLRVPLGGAIVLAFFAALPARADYQSTVLGQSPAGYWRLNETTQPPTPPINATNAGSVGSPAGDGVYYNEVRGVTPGAIVSEPTSAAVQFTAAVDGNRVRIPYQPQWNTAGPFSVEFWIRPDRTNTTQCVAADVEFIASTPTPQRNGWLIYQGNAPGLTDGQGWSFRLYNSTALNGLSQANYVGPLDPNGWYHIVGAFDGTNIKLYTNGYIAATTAITGTFRPNTNSAIPLTFGARADGASGYFVSKATFDEAAYYTTALSDGQVLAHYQAGTNAVPSTPYSQVILNDTPVGYWRFNEPGDVAAANIGTLVSAATGTYQVGTTPGVAGPRQSAYPGFEVDNDAVSVPGTGPAVSVPPLNFNTNTVTITGWVKPSTSAESVSAGIVLCDAGTTYAGLTIDLNGGLGLGYVWAGASSTYNWIPATDPNYLLPTLPVSDWAYVALVVRPDQAWIYTCASNNPARFAGATNHYAHVNQAFDGATLFGWDPNTLVNAGFAGSIDEVAIWNRALGVGELYTQYGAAVGGLKPIIFGDLQGPAGSVAAGDPIVLSVDAGGTPPLTYTWHRGGTNYASTTTGVLTIPISSLDDAGTYDVHISNGSGSADSQPVHVDVVVPSTPQIQQILGYQSRTLYPAGTLSFAAIATGGGLQYQWYKNASPIASATSSAFSIARLVATDAGSYSVSVTNIVGAATSGPPAVITIASLTPGSYEAAIVASAPEAWWRMDEATGSTNMWDSMGRHDGCYTNLTGATPPVTLGATGALLGDTNTAASFVAANQAFGYVPFAPALNPQVMTIECWVKTASSTVSGLAPVSSRVTGAGWWWQTDVEGGTGYWIPFGSDAAHTAWRTPLEGTANAATATIVPGQWSHLVLIVDTTSGYPITPYINGVGFGSWGFNAIGNFNGSGPFLIGARGASPGAIADTFFDGQVDEVAVYNYALTPTEITNHFIARGIVIIPPFFTTPLLSQTVTTGKSISFSTSVLGTAPISLQWYKDGKLIIDATNSTYAITNTLLGDAGTYALWAMNSAATTNISASLVVISPVSYANVTNNLVLHLTFDGDTTDSSGRGNNGTPSTSNPPDAPPVFVPGIIGTQALHYETVVVTNVGVSTNIQSASYVTLGTVGSGPPTDLQFGASTSFSVSLWVKLDAGALPPDLPFIGTSTNSNNYPGWDLSPSFYLGGWQFNLNDGVINSGNNVNVNGPNNSINDGNWHNFVLTVDRTAKVANSYVDGVLGASISIPTLGNIDNNNYWPIVIGQDPTYQYHQGAYGPFAGSATLDDIGIWRQALTALEVAQIASAGSTAGRSFNTVAPSGGTQPDITGISVSGGTVTIKFTGGASDPASAFTLFSSGTVSGVYNSAAGAVVTGSAGSYTATVPTNGAMQFYRIQR